MAIQEREGQQQEEEEQKKKGGGPCGAGASKGKSSSDSAEYPSGGDPEKMGDVGIDDVDASVNSMCKKVFTVYRAIPKEFSCPQTQRDNVADQFTPQDDLLTMEKTCRDFLKLEGKIYDPQTTNPRFFAPEGWVQHYEKDKNVVLAALDQYKANIIRMEHLYTLVDKNSYGKLKSIPNQDCKEAFQTNVMWTARSLKDWANNWFIKRGPDSCTKRYDKDYWVPGLTGQMVEWMKLGSYNQFNMNPIANETSIQLVDKLEAVIDRLMNKAAVDETISKYLNVKEEIEATADQKKEKIFTSKVIDSQMGKKLGVTDTGIENQKPEGTTYVAPKEDAVEQFNLVDKLSCVKSLFKTFREKSMVAMKSCRCVSSSGPGPYPQIWTNIDVLAAKVYGALDVMNELVEDQLGDHENPGWHCSITHTRMCPKKLKKHITAFKCVIQKGVIDVMTNQALLPKKGKNILDSMFNQLWEYGEKGPTLELPSWCQMAIDSINAFEDSLLDAWTEVYDCWEREFLTRLWHIEVEHHGGGSDGILSYGMNWQRQQTVPVTTMHNHTHQIPFNTVIMEAAESGSPVVVDQEVVTDTAESTGCDSYNFDTIPLIGYFTCPGHCCPGEGLLAPICVCYKVNNIAFLSENYRPFVKELCQWMVAAIEAIGIKQAAISAVMADPTLNGNCCNDEYLNKINDLREKNNKLLAKVEHAYGIYSDVNNMKNKKEYDEEIALHELQPNKYSNEDMLNMGSSLQSEASETSLDSELCQGGIDIKELKPWNHLTLGENKVKPECLPCKCACNKFDKLIKSISGFESWFSK